MNKRQHINALPGRVVVRYRVNEALEKMMPEKRYSLCLHVIEKGSNNDKRLNEYALLDVNLDTVRIIYETEAIKQAMKLADGNQTKEETLLLTLLNRVKNGYRHISEGELRNEIYRAIELLVERCDPLRIETRIIQDEIERLRKGV